MVNVHFLLSPPFSLFSDLTQELVLKGPNENAVLHFMIFLMNIISLFSSFFAFFIKSFYKTQYLSE